MGLFGGIEAGGTKFSCIIGSGPENIHKVIHFPTTTPAETIHKAIQFFQSQPQLISLGIGSFGPIDNDPISPQYGYILKTPKPNWDFTDLLGPLKEALKIPVGFDTDVNVALLGEQTWGAAQTLNNALYLTVGTGLGGSAIVNGKFVHGLMHPEMGHVRVPHDWEADPFSGVCPYHGDCLEGLASGTALEQRWGQPAETLAPDHPAWELQAHYLALALVNLICTFSPEQIIMGGGVMDQTHLFPDTRSKVVRLLNGYIQANEILENSDTYIVPPKLKNRAGLLGAIALAQSTAKNILSEENYGNW